MFCCCGDTDPDSPNGEIEDKCEIHTKLLDNEFVETKNYQNNPIQTRNLITMQKSDN